MIIVGAGLAGLIAAHAWPTARVFEAGPPGAMHNALLRFRTDAVARLTGTEFRRVTVRKGVWSTVDQAFMQPDIRAANLYALKCTGRLLGERSIWSPEPVERFIAPNDFYDQLIENVGGRIRWNEPFVFDSRRDEPVISTAPMPIICDGLLLAAASDFLRAPITVQRLRVPGADVHQTVYFPEHEHTCYRASITGDTLIVEHAGVDPSGDWDDDVACAFGLDWNALEPLGVARQSFGKIAPIDEGRRKSIMFELTHRHGIFSLGRFATWRNILLDDVVADIDVIKRLLRSGAAYDLRKEGAR